VLGSDSYDAASASSWGLDALHGPHHVAEKQTNENALLERNDESSSELDNSWRAPMVIIQCEIAQDIMYSANT